VVAMLQTSFLTWNACHQPDLSPGEGDLDGGIEDDSEKDHDEFLMLNESDIPSASLHGKDPRQLNVTQLKR